MKLQKQMNQKQEKGYIVNGVLMFGLVKKEENKEVLLFQVDNRNMSKLKLKSKIW